MFYLSLNSIELGILLSQATGDETQLYIVLRKFADFKTGEMTHPAAGRLNLAYLARMLSREARQGRKATTMHREDIRRGLERLRRSWAGGRPWQERKGVDDAASLGRIRT